MGACFIKSQNNGAIRILLLKRILFSKKQVDKPIETCYDISRERENKKPLGRYQISTSERKGRRCHCTIAKHRPWPAFPD
jgi:hypothetical protein